MNRILISMMTFILISSLSFAQQNKGVVLKDTTGKDKITITGIESAEEIDAEDSAFFNVANDSVVVGSHGYELLPEDRIEQYIERSNFPFAHALLIPIVAIIFGTLLPVAIVLIVLYYRNKEKKAKYRLAEQALANGQPLPENLFSTVEEEKNTFNKGVKNIFMGIGLFIFLWAITEKLSIGCIGLLIMFTGFGQVIIYYNQHPKVKNFPPKDIENSNNNAREEIGTPRNEADSTKAE